MRRSSRSTCCCDPVNVPDVIEMVGVEVADSRRPGRGPLVGVDWSVARGECWVVSGLQGSGISGLLETAAGLRPVAAGELKLFGEPLAPLRGDELTGIRKRIGVLFSGTGRLFSSLTVMENVTLPLRYHEDLSLSAAAESVAPLLEALGIESVSAALPAHLGKSWTLRVALARALALRPELLLLDDPFSGLDSGQFRWWRTLIESVASGHPWLLGKPATVVIGTDTLRPLLGLGHRFALIDRGAWRVLGDRQNVLACEESGLREVLGDPS